MKSAQGQERGATQEAPTMTEVQLSPGVSYRIRMRRKLHDVEPLGVVVSSRQGNRTLSVTQYDLKPDLDPVTRSMTQDMLRSAFDHLAQADSFTKGITQLEKLAESNLCMRCTFTPVKG